jgi:adenylate cyclase
MGLEIEKKFLLLGETYKTAATKQVRIIQGYLSSAPERTVRVRIKDDSAYLTIKGAANVTGASRYEWEKEIVLEEARELLKICEPGVIDKTRYLVPAGKHIIEVDEFYGDNQGLVMAEIELAAEDEAFEKPAWLGEEVTGDARYYNAMLVKHPYSRWNA